VGRDVRLTLDARLQQAAQTLLKDEIGGAVLLDAHTGEVLALASNPIYDPQTVAETWETLSEAPDSPFLNRVTQGLAQPGSSLQPFILTTAWQQTPGLAPAEPISRSIPLNGLFVTCRGNPATTSWQSALAMACPYPFTELVATMGQAAFFDSLTRWGFLDAPAFTLPTVAAETAPGDPAQEALGQGNLLVTPLQMVSAIAVLGNEGIAPHLHVLAQPVTGCNEPVAAPAQRVVDPDTAKDILHTLPQFGAAVGHLGTAFAGQDREQAWFVGLNSPDLPRYAVAVLIDQTQRAQKAADIGTDLLRLVREN
jgi:peptidoglycan glycosyltransferase